MKPAFSTIACADWTLAPVADLADRAGFLGVELRTFGHGSTEIACDPCLTQGAKIRQMFSRAGAEAMCLASSIRFDDPFVTPPVIGHLLCDEEKSVKQTKSLVDVARVIECPLVRVFAFELRPGERRSAALRRICTRLDLALRTARNTGVRLVLENGGSFATAADLREILDMIASPSLAAAYSPAVGVAAGDDPADAVRILGRDLVSVKLTDHADGLPVPLGEGTAPNHETVRALAEVGYDGWLVYEWPRMWHEGLQGDDPTHVIEQAANALYGWIGEARPSRRRPSVAGAA